MSMRHNLRDKFSTFLIIEDDQGNRYHWIVDPRLRRSFDAVLALDSYADATEEEIVRYFWNNLRNSNPRIVEISRSHLAAYLQETCYFITKKLCIQMGKKNSLRARDALSFVHQSICQPNFFKRYNPTKKAKLITYASRAIRNILLDFLTDTVARSDWGRFYHLAQVRLREILVSMNFRPYRNSEDYVYIHRFYIEICPPLGNNAVRTKPNSEQLQAICDLYNSQFSQNNDFVALNPQEALQIMQDCIGTILRIQRIENSPLSLDAPINSSDDSETSSLIDVIAQSSQYQDQSVLEDDQLSDLTDLDAKLTHIVNQEIESLTLERQSIFLLLHGFNCKMIKFAPLYGVNQSNISRKRYCPAFDNIVDKCVVFCQQQVSSLDVNDFSWRNDLQQWLKNYLNSYYKNKIHQLLESLISSYYQKNIQEPHKFRNPTEYMCVKGDELLVIGVDLVINYLQQKFNITQSCQPILPDINNFIKSWISDRPTN